MPTAPSRPPAVQLLRKLGMEPDSWQLDVLDGDQPRLLLNCSRQAGKSTVVAMLALARALFVPGTKVLLVSRSHRQSKELFGIVTEFYRRFDKPMLERLSSEELRLSNYSRIVSLPCREETIRGYSRVSLLVVDEAARVPDDLFRAVMPMLAVSNGRLVCLSTPYGRRGFFYDAWSRGGDDWSRIEVPAAQVSRISSDFLARERRTLGELWYRQEYECSFEALAGLVYPDFNRCVIPGPAPAGGRRVGGIDFGFRNPFAAVWGTLDRDDVLWLTGEHYARQKPLSYHAEHLPRDVDWSADPSGAAEISELRCADRVVRRGINALQFGIAAVTARLADGRLRVVEGACPNLLAEACLYRYPEEGEGGNENPLDEHNHALAALRYLVSRLDERRMARRAAAVSSPSETQEEEQRDAKTLEAQERRRKQLQHLWMHAGCWTSWGS
jgi:Terminase large subunit, T4likevirus-type, N-terminal